MPAAEIRAVCDPTYVAAGILVYYACAHGYNLADRHPLVPASYEMVAWSGLTLPVLQIVARSAPCVFQDFI